jgi:flagellar P-ring protein precursor FlgI
MTQNQIKGDSLPVPRAHAVIVAILMLLGTAPLSMAVRIADITRLGGQRTNVLTGLGLVYGLAGTGDGGDFAAAIKPLAGMLSKFADPVTTEELTKVQNVAVVGLMATIPSNGVRDGDHIDVRVMSLGAASSLNNGILFVSPMQSPVPNGGVFAMAQGQLKIEDPTDPNVAVIHGGAVMEADMLPKYIDNGQITFILEDPSANWTNASMIAKIINDAEGTDGETLAFAVDPKNVVVTIPVTEREHPDSFISRIQRLPIPMLPSEARVQINEKTGTLIVTGDVEISPVVISHKGLTITTIAPPPVPSIRNPLIGTKDLVALDPANQGGAKLQDLVGALEQLKVPAEDRITIVEELYKSGKLHAKLVLEEQ